MQQQCFRRKPITDVFLFVLFVFPGVLNAKAFITLEVPVERAYVTAHVCAARRHIPVYVYHVIRSGMLITHVANSRAKTHTPNALSY